MYMLESTNTKFEVVCETTQEKSTGSWRRGGVPAMEGWLGQASLYMYVIMLKASLKEGVWAQIEETDHKPS